MTTTGAAAVLSYRLWRSLIIIVILFNIVAIDVLAIIPRDHSYFNHRREDGDMDIVGNCALSFHPKTHPTIYNATFWAENNVLTEEGDMRLSCDFRHYLEENYPPCKTMPVLANNLEFIQFKVNYGTTRNISYEDSKMVEFRVPIDKVLKQLAENKNKEPAVDSKNENDATYETFLKYYPIDKINVQITTDSRRVIAVNLHISKDQINVWRGQYYKRVEISNYLDKLIVHESERV